MKLKPLTGYTIRSVSAFLLFGLITFSFQNCSKLEINDPSSTASFGSESEEVVPSSCEAISFRPLVGVALSARISSETIRLPSCSKPLRVSYSGDGSPELYRNGILVVESTFVQSGDTLILKMTSSSLDNTQYRSVLNIGSSSAIFSMTTASFTPAAISFTPKTGQPLEVDVTSNVVVLAGFEGRLLASVSGVSNRGAPRIVLNGVEVGTETFVKVGDALAIRMTSAKTNYTTYKAVLLVGAHASGGNPSSGLSSIYELTTQPGNNNAVPVMTSIDAPGNGAYKSGSALVFKLNFSEDVKITGVPRLAINLGGAVKYANYVSGSNTSSLQFRYVVESGMSDSNGLAITALQLNGGSIVSGANIAANLALANVSTAGIFIDTTLPQVSKVVSPGAGDYHSGQFLNFVVEFSEAVNVVGLPKLKLSIGIFERYAEYVSGTGTRNLKFRYHLELEDVDPNGISLLGSIQANGATLRDAALNAADLSFSSPNLEAVRIVVNPDLNLPAGPSLSTKLISSKDCAGGPEASFFVLMGQSNAMGFGKVSEMVNGSNFAREYWLTNGYKFKYWTNDSSSWRSGDSVLSGRAATPTNFFGPEVNLAASLQSRGWRNFYVFKSAFANSSLAENWLSRGRGGLYDSSIARLRTAATQVCKLGYQPVVKGVFWMQGETDGTSESFAGSYVSNLTRTIQQLREDIMTVDTPFLMGLIRSSPWPLAAVIRSSQWTVSENLKHVSAFETDDLGAYTGACANGQRDGLCGGVHYNTAGVMSLGRRFYEAFYEDTKLLGY